MGAGFGGEFQTGLDTHVPMQLHTGGKGLFPPAYKVNPASPVLW